MKFFNYYVVLSIVILGVISVKVKLKTEKFSNKLMSHSQIDEKDKNPEKVPIINVHMEEPDRDPIEVKRIEEERRIERNRIREMEMMEEMDKRTFQQIISLQNSQLAKLADIADKTTLLLNTVTTKAIGGNGPNHISFKQADTYRTVFDDMIKNGPLNIDEHY